MYIIHKFLHYYMTDSEHCCWVDGFPALYLGGPGVKSWPKDWIS